MNNSNSTILTTDKSEQSVRTTCCYCGVGCGVSAILKNGQLTGVSGDKTHPANNGKLCVKGSSLHQTQDLTDRLLTPMLDGQATNWSHAMETAATRFKDIIDKHGPNSVAFYLSGQLLTEDYYVANKLMKGFIGSANIDTNSRLCMASAVVAHKRAFGEDIVAGTYSDLECTDLLLLVGSNMAYTHPIVYQRLVAAKKKRPEMKIVVLDPRKTATCDVADIHLPIRPGCDAYFFNGLLNYIESQGGLDEAFIHAHCNHFHEAIDAAKKQLPTLASVAQACDVDQMLLQSVYDDFIQHRKVVTVFSQGINQSSSGADKGNSIINCHLATGKIGKPGCAPFSITGQPNAMGGREVGGLANQLAAHMGFSSEDIHRVSEFWNATNMAQTEGLKAVDMFDAIYDGKIKAIWIMATNPAVSMPDANKVRQALKTCELVIVSECVANTDTALLADIVLPATTWGEKTGTVTNSERCISLQKGFQPPPGQARNDWEIIVEFAHRLGFGHWFPYKHVADIFREHAALSGYKNNGTRAFDISGYRSINNNNFENLKPFFWPIKGEPNSPSLFSDGYFYTTNGKANFIPIIATLPSVAPGEKQFIMNTGRIRDQWHTMSRTGVSARLVSHTDEPYIEMNSADALKTHLSNNSLAEISSQYGRYVGRIKLSSQVREGELFVPIHWNDRFASNACVSAIVAPRTDPISGQPEFKHMPVSLKPYSPNWQALLITNRSFTPQSGYWVKIPTSTGFKYRLAGTNTISSFQQHWHHWLHTHFPEIEDWSELVDSQSQFYRSTGFIDEKLAVSLFVSGIDDLLSEENDWLEKKTGIQCDNTERYMVLAGSTGAAGSKKVKIICSCFEIGELQINAAIKAGCLTAEELGKQLKCGTNCGSCVPELNALIQQKQKMS